MGTWEHNPSFPARGSRSLSGAGAGRKEAWPDNELREAAAAKGEVLSQQTKGLKPEIPSCCCPVLSWGKILVGDVPSASSMRGKGSCTSPRGQIPASATGACRVLEAGGLALRKVGRKWLINTARVEQVGTEISVLLALMSVFSSCPGFPSMQPSVVDWAAQTPSPSRTLGKFPFFGVHSVQSSPVLGHSTVTWSSAKHSTQCTSHPDPRAVVGTNHKHK